MRGMSYPRPMDWQLDKYRCTDRSGPGGQRCQLIVEHGTPAHIASIGGTFRAWVGTLRVRGTVARIDGKLVTTAPKTARSRLTVPLAAPVVALLRAHRKTQREDRMRAANVWQETGHVFSTEEGRPIEPRNLLRML